MPETSPLTYRAAGVNIDAGNELVNRIKPFAKKTRRPEVLGDLGGFGALFELPWQRYRQPVLVSTTDGVGTKLKLAQQMQKHDTIGIDLVAMCVNDLIVCGAEPLLFLDYYATGKLNVDTASTVIQGIASGCQQAGVALVGGETAEMPGMYHHEDYDLAGFCVGLVEKQYIIDGSMAKPGDHLIGLASSGPHANGYSLIHTIVRCSQTSLDQPFGSSTLGETLLTPTRIYVKPIQQVLKQGLPIKAMAHITGGGLLENLPRVLPNHCQAVINTSAWQRPTIFDWLQHQGNIATHEMYRVFNCGIGMVLVSPPEFTEPILAVLRQQGESAWLIGHLVQGERACVTLQ